MCNLLRGLLTLTIPLLPKEFIGLLAIAFLVSMLTQFFAPAEQSAIPLLVEAPGLMSANALFTTTIIGSLIVGFAIGEPLLSWARSTLGDFGQELLVGGSVSHRCWNFAGNSHWRGSSLTPAPDRSLE
ncbi:hypothetical protein [Neosynechococcus sphagnicola]|uniref:hypothetical protein n=1 Tax=Neosynechococcus sphagnicola TaxID=1501145 RepID=UPI001EF9D5A9|nr:hypothetical protein [Neosynechococcus sphagnicola]